VGVKIAPNKLTIRLIVFGANKGNIFSRKKSGNFYRLQLPQFSCMTLSTILLLFAFQMYKFIVANLFSFNEKVAHKFTLTIGQ
jgi:hypothetical protein